MDARNTMVNMAWWLNWISVMLYGLCFYYVRKSIAALHARIVELERRERKRGGSE